MDGKIKRCGMTLVEVIVATALFAIFLSLALGLLQMTVGYNARLWEQRKRRHNRQVMVDFLKEEIGLASSVCLFVDWDGNFATRDEVDIRHKVHNFNQQTFQVPTEPKKLMKVVFDYNTPKSKTLSVNQRKMTFQGEVVGEQLRWIEIVCDEEVRLVTLAFEMADPAMSEDEERLEIVEDLGSKK